MSDNFILDVNTEEEADAALRHDYVNGCESSPVVYLEGIYVQPTSRRRGLAQALIARVAQWGSELGCRELASDAAIDNLASQQLHQRLGFAETERVFRGRHRARYERRGLCHVG